MEYLRREDILLINRMSVDQHGGNFNPPENLLHPSSLEYVLESVAGELFGQPLYPSLADKAAVYMFNIISNHVFSDGNKRTGLEAALLFLRLNGYTLPTNSDKYEGVPNGYIYQFTLAVAAGQYDLEAIRAWFAEHIVPLRG